MTPARSLVDRLQAHGSRTALVDERGAVDFYSLEQISSRVATVLLDGAADLDGARIAFFLPPGRDYVTTLVGIWRAGGIAVPLALSHTADELAYVVRDAGASIVVTGGESLERLTAIASSLGGRCVAFDQLRADGLRPLPSVSPDRRALILYTSGTTSKPKGVVTTHANVAAQIQSLIDAWGWTASDRTLLVLPLHHVHGLINVVGCALWSGATCEVAPRFHVDATWSRLASGELTVFTAVPTIYYRLIQAWEATPDQQAERADGARQVRLMMSGSAALPVPMLERWREITGQTLLERYGMTEIGMALSSPLNGERRPGYVGQPLPGVEVRIVTEQGSVQPDGTQGEIEVRGQGVFAEYWRRPEATKAAFRDGWFRTGDVAVVEDGAYRLLGRASVDILKTGGHKISALEIEDTLRQHPAVSDCAVVGVDDAEWGQRVCVAIERQDDADADSVEAIQSWLSDLLAPYKQPRDYRLVGALPRNAMGKVVKSQVVALFRS